MRGLGLSDTRLSCEGTGEGCRDCKGVLVHENVTDRRGDDGLLVDMGDRGGDFKILMRDGNSKEELLSNGGIFTGDLRDLGGEGDLERERDLLILDRDVNTDDLLDFDMTFCPSHDLWKGRGLGGQTKGGAFSWD